MAIHASKALSSYLFLIDKLKKLKKQKLIFKKRPFIYIAFQLSIVSGYWVINY